MPYDVHWLRVDASACDPKEKSGCKHSAHARRMVELFPEFAEYLEEGQQDGPSHGKSRKRQFAPAAENNEVGPAELDENAMDGLVQEAWEALDLARNTWQDAHVAHQDFLTRILGGKWTVTHKKVACDAIVGYSKGKEAQAWATHFGLDRINSFAYSRYDQHPASCMALEWCRRMQHFYDIYTGRDDPDFEYSAEELESYEESIEFIDLMRAIPDEHLFTLERCRKLRNMKWLIRNRRRRREACLNMH